MAIALEHIVQRRRAWATHALNAGHDVYAAVFWADALILESHRADIGLGDNPLILDLGEQLRALPDSDRAVNVLNRIMSSVEDDTNVGQLAFLLATILYGQGSMDDALAMLDKAASILSDKWSGEETLTAGLIRVVALIKLQRINDAASVLKELEDVQGYSDQAAQVVFLRGWIGLNRNRTSEALQAFRCVVDEYPSSSYADKARELIQRLEPMEIMVDN